MTFRWFRSKHLRIFFSWFTEGWVGNGNGCESGGGGIAVVIHGVVGDGDCGGVLVGWVGGGVMKELLTSVDLSFIIPTLVCKISNMLSRTILIETKIYSASKFSKIGH